jgi:hypothetical protein
MTEPAFNRATHFSIVWAVVLAVLTLVEWHSLDREPLNEQIFLPFIERDITMTVTDSNAGDSPGVTGGDLPGVDESRSLQTHVQIDFNGPLFLVYFFGPILILQGIGMGVARLRQRD